MRPAATFAAGAIAGALLALLLTSNVTSRQASVPRPAQADLRRVEAPARTEAPTLRPSPSASGVAASADPASARPSPSTSTRAARTEAPATAKPSPAKPATRHRLDGTATWYSYRRGQAAAGPRLREALGKGWRGRTVLVNGVPVRLTDYMGTKNRAKVIDLDDGLFVRICGRLSMGVCEVTVRW